MSSMLSLIKLQQQAKRQNCVLERESRGYSLYSNSSFVQADCADLKEVADCLNYDGSFETVSNYLATL